MKVRRWRVVAWILGSLALAGILANSIFYADTHRWESLVAVILEVVALAIVLGVVSRW